MKPLLKFIATTTAIAGALALTAPSFAALKAGDPMPIDIYDAVAWSAITPLSEQSIAEDYKTLAFPDFTEGKWKDRKPIFAFDGRY